jgi:alpha-galactosidase
MSEVIDEIPVDPATARVYAEGWQSWSPATWYAAGTTGQAPHEDSQHLMRFRPGTPVAPTGVQGEGLLVVEPGTGAPARLFAAPDLVTIPTLRAELVGNRVVVRSNGPVTMRAHGGGGVAALSAYGDEVGVAPTSVPPRVWCSWYHYFEDVTTADVEENLDSIEREDLAVDVVQVDDGWSPGLGEGLLEADSFGSLPALVDRIRGSGRRAGIWLAPFLVGAETTLAREHPDWLVGPAGRNWDQELLGLDLSHPGVRELLSGHLERLTGLGIDFFKLDFLYAGAVPGPRHDDVDPVAAYRSGLSLIREVVGDDAYLLGCGAPLLPSVGLADAMRVSPDTFHEGGEDGSTGLRGLMPLAARAWQQGRLWVNDPDCVVARPSYSQRERWAEVARRYGGLRTISDRIGELDDWGLRTVRKLLADGGRPGPLSDEDVRLGAAVALAEGAE